MKCIVRTFFCPWKSKCIQMTSCYVSLVIYPDNVQIFKHNIWSLEYFLYKGRISKTLTIPLLSIIDAFRFPLIELLM